MAPGARSKFGAPVFEPEVFRKQICCWRKYLWYCKDFLAPLAVVLHTHNDSATGELRPPCPLRYASALGPFESKVLHITTGVGGPIESRVACFCIAVAVRPLRKQGTLHIKVAIRGLWKRGEPTHTLQLLLWSLWKQSTYTMKLLLGTLVKQSTCTLQLSFRALLKAE